MTEEIHEIERLIKQSGELADSLIRLARKLQEHNQTTKAAFEADGDILEKIKPFLITIIVPSAHDSVIRRENALGAPVRSPSSSSCCPADLHVLNGFVTVRASCSTPNSSQAWTSASKSDRWLRWFRLQTLTQDFPPKRVDQAAGFSAHLQCRRSRRFRGYRL